MKLNLSTSGFTGFAATAMVALFTLGGAAFAQTTEAVDNIARETASEAQQGVGEVRGGLQTIINRLDQVETDLATTTAKTGSNMQAITDEATARQTEDANLQAQIDSLGGGSGALLVLDATGTLIGMGQTPGSTNARVFPVVPALSSLTFDASVAPSGFLDQGNVYFTSSDCTGTPYLTTNSLSTTWANFSRAQVIVCPGGRTSARTCNGTAELWLPLDNSVGAIEQIFTSSFRFSSDGECRLDFGVPRNVTQATLIGDLHSEFQLPFSLVFPGQ